jgi:hypothetical protein
MLLTPISWNPGTTTNLPSLCPPLIVGFETKCTCPRSYRTIRRARLLAL